MFALLILRIFAANPALRGLINHGVLIMELKENALLALDTVHQKPTKGIATLIMEF
jgi:hypothetical protein